MDGWMMGHWAFPYSYSKYVNISIKENVFIIFNFRWMDG